MSRWTPPPPPHPFYPGPPIPIRWGTLRNNQLGRQRRTEMFFGLCGAGHRGMEGDYTTRLVFIQNAQKQGVQKSTQTRKIF